MTKYSGTGLDTARTEAIAAERRGELPNAYVCASCHNIFLQPPTCTTCGAQKLYDNTLRTAERERDALRARCDELAAALHRIVHCDAMMADMEARLCKEIARAALTKVQP